MKIIPKIIIFIITLIAGATFVTFLVEEIEDITNKIVLMLSGIWLFTMILLNLTNTLIEDKKENERKTKGANK